MPILPQLAPITVRPTSTDTFEAWQLPADGAFPYGWADLATLWRRCASGLVRIQARDDLTEIALPGDWIVRRRQTAELHICPPDAFDTRWEPVPPAPAPASPAANEL